MSIRGGCVVTILLLLSAMACSAEKAGSTSSGALGSTWADADKMPAIFGGMWMTNSAMAEADPKLNVPYTAKAQKYVAAYKPRLDIPYAEEGCKSPGLPMGMYLGPVTFTYAPGLISVYMQAVGHTRFIRLNQKQGKTSPKYYGNSIGHFEGDTLVVETEDFLPEITFQYGVGKAVPREGPLPGPGGVDGGPGAEAALSALSALTAAIWGPHGEGMRMVERIRLLNPQTLELKLTLYDDTVWTEPYVAATRTFRRIQPGNRGPFSGDPEEWVCTVSITSFDPDTNSYNDKDPGEMVKYLDKLGR